MRVHRLGMYGVDLAHNRKRRMRSRIVSNLASTMNRLSRSHQKTEVELVNCGTCVACCKQAVMLMGDEDHTQYEVHTVHGANLVDGTSPTHWLKRQDNGDCFYLVDDKCSIYDRRPRICKAFSCVGWVKKIMRDHPRPERRRMMKAGQLDPEIWAAGAERINDE
jgi:hypothetical protein